MDSRVERLELQFSEWQSVLRVRAQGLTSLQTRAADMDKDLWKMKNQLGSLCWPDVERALGDSQPPERLATLKAEFVQVFDAEHDLIGVFPVGAQLHQAAVFDIRYRPSLNGFRANTLVKTHLGPALKATGSHVQFWVPLSSAENQKRRKRKASNPPDAPEATAKSRSAPRREVAPRSNAAPRRGDNDRRR